MGVQEIMTITEPFNGADTVEADLALPVRGFVVDWEPIEAATRYSWSLGKTDNNSYEHVRNGTVNEPSVQIVRADLRRGSSYRLSITGWSDDGTQVGTLWISYSDRMTAPFVRFRVE